MPKIRYYIRAKSREGKTIFLLVTWCFNRERIAWTTKINDKKMGYSNWAFESLENSQEEYKCILRAHRKGYVKKEAIDKPYSWY